MRRATLSLSAASVVSVVASVALIALASCNEDSGADIGRGDHEPAPFPAATSTSGAPTYPPGPYGVSAGSIIESFSFQGFADAKASSAALQPISLGDFYNPHVNESTYAPASPAEDDRLYPPGSPYGAGKAKPRALLMDFASVWCGPCNQEAKSVLPGMYAKFSPCGGEFLFQLAQGTMPNTEATETNLRAWTTAYKVDYPATIDPAQQLTSLYGQSFPDSAIIDTSTMTIIELINGVPEDSFWGDFQNAVNNPACFAAGK
jgi:hypothetical protein